MLTLSFMWITVDIFVFGVTLKEDLPRAGCTFIMMSVQRRSKSVRSLTQESPFVRVSEKNVPTAQPPAQENDNTTPVSFPSPEKSYLCDEYSFELMTLF